MSPVIRTELHDNSGGIRGKDLPARQQTRSNCAELELMLFEFGLSVHNFVDKTCKYFTKREWKSKFINVPYIT